MVPHFCLSIAGWHWRAWKCEVHEVFVAWEQPLNYCIRNGRINSSCFVDPLYCRSDDIDLIFFMPIDRLWKHHVCEVLPCVSLVMIPPPHCLLEMVLKLCYQYLSLKCIEGRSYIMTYLIRKNWILSFRYLYLLKFHENSPVAWR